MIFISTGYILILLAIISVSTSHNLNQLGISVSTGHNLYRPGISTTTGHNLYRPEA